MSMAQTFGVESPLEINSAQLQFGFGPAGDTFACQDSSLFVVL